MKRTDISGIFPEATDEQINQLMSIYGADINNAKNGVDDLKTQLTEANTALEQLRASSEAFEEERKQHQAVSEELENLKAANALREMREKVSKASGVPIHLLTGDTEEACKQQADNIKEYARPSTYPRVQDGGEPNGYASQSNKEKFAEWFSEIAQ